MKSSFELILNEGIKKIDDAINWHERNEVAPLSFKVLMQVKKRTGRNEKSDGSKGLYAGISSFYFRLAR